MPNFIKHAKVTAPFQGYSLQVAHQVGHQHTGLDMKKGYGRPWMSNNDGVAYKVFYPDSRFEWSAVHMLVKDGEDWCEVVPLGHASKIVVREGDFIHAGQLVGYEGNHGEVYTNNRKVTVEERLAGSRAGTHNHVLYRPIVLVDELVSDGKSHYLRDIHGNAFKFQGKYCKIKHTNNTKGCVDPMTYYPKDVAVRFDLMALNAKVEGDYKTSGMYSAIASVLRSFIS